MHIARTPTHAEELARSLMLGQAGPTDPRSEIAKHAHGRFWRILFAKVFFVSPITNFPGCRRGDRILMWGTTSFRDELSADFGGAFDATSIGGCRLFCRSAEI
jgi:hypothetical protein